MLLHHRGMLGYSTENEKIFHKYTDKIKCPKKINNSNIFAWNIKLSWSKHNSIIQLQNQFTFYQKKFKFLSFSTQLNKTFVKMDKLIILFGSLASEDISFNKNIKNFCFHTRCLKDNHKVIVDKILV